MADLVSRRNLYSISAVMFENVTPKRVRKVEKTEMRTVFYLRCSVVFINGLGPLHSVAIVPPKTAKSLLKSTEVRSRRLAACDLAFDP